jgi:hypothetical protein
MVTPRGMVWLAFIAIVLMLAAIEVLFRGTNYERRNRLQIKIC